MDWGRIKENIVMAVALPALGLVAGWLFGTNQTAQMANDIAVIKTGVEEIKVSNKTRDRFDRCSELRIDRLEHGIKQPAECGEGD